MFLTCNSFIHDVSKVSTFLSWRWQFPPYETKWCHSPARRQSQLRREFTFKARSWHIRFSDTSSNSGTVLLLLSNGPAKYTGIRSRESAFCSFSIHWNIWVLQSIDGAWHILFPTQTVWFVSLDVLHFLLSFLCVISIVTVIVFPCWLHLRTELTKWCTSSRHPPFHQPREVFYTPVCAKAQVLSCLARYQLKDPLTSRCAVSSVRILHIPALLSHRLAATSKLSVPEELESSALLLACMARAVFQVCWRSAAMQNCLSTVELLQGVLGRFWCGANVSWPIRLGRMIRFSHLGFFSFF